MTGNRTTDLKQLRAGKPFTWGELIKIHEFFDYAIVEFHPFVFNGPIGTDKINYNKTDYSIYVCGEGIGHSSDTADAAIAEAIAYKYDGCNTQAGIFFMKMIR